MRRTRVRSRVVKLCFGRSLLFPLESDCDGLTNRWAALYSDGPERHHNARAHVVYFTPFLFVGVGPGDKGKAGEEPFHHNVDGIQGRPVSIEAGLAGGIVQSRKSSTVSRSGAAALTRRCSRRTVSSGVDRPF